MKVSKMKSTTSRRETVGGGLINLEGKIRFSNYPPTAQEEEKAKDEFKELGLTQARAIKSGS